jgi:hypothetical protein
MAKIDGVGAFLATKLMLFHRVFLGAMGRDFMPFFAE